eukprot:TRINITY_DN73679_c0_g1_i1.p1 TRINITY_DN73679_c0_g1~~TRINITY_DN73679_c0_g1_i1.p1  ORF type:complete len:213 (+),score=35.92 TRINITY_DN73679_c0_g1_i1:55-693(+)
MQYSKEKYWDQRYERNSDPYDFYVRWDGLKTTFQQYIQPENTILHVGAGLSALGESMYADGYRNITNVDLSGVCVEAMTERYAKKFPESEDITYSQMDVHALDIPDEIFNVVIEKALLDSQMCSQEPLGAALKMLQEISRVLLPGGVFLCVSHSPPQFRSPALQRDEFKWKVKTEKIMKPMMGMSPSLSTEDEKENTLYIYVCQKALRNDDE